MVCNKCDRENPDNSSHCSYCGDELVENKPTESNEPASKENQINFQDSETKEKEVSKKSKRMSFIGLSILLFFILIYIFSQNNLEFIIWDMTRDETSYLNYFNDHYKIEKDLKYVNKSIRKLIAWQSENALTTFSGIITNASEPYNIRALIVEEYSNNKENQLNLDVLVDCLLMTDLEANSLKRLINAYPTKEVECKVLGYLSKLANKENWDEFGKLTIKYNNSQLNKSKLLNCIEEIYSYTYNNEINENFLKMENNINEVQEMYENSINQYNDFKRDIEDLRNREYEAYGEYENKKRELEALNSGTEILMYIVGLAVETYEESQYEVTFSRLSSDRGILKTKKNAYVRQGWVKPSVVYMGTKTITLKEEFGSFKQEWPVYMEESLYQATHGWIDEEILRVLKNDYEKLDEEYSKSLEEETKILEEIGSTEKNLDNAKRNYSDQKIHFTERENVTKEYLLKALKSYNSEIFVLGDLMEEFYLKTDELSNKQLDESKSQATSPLNNMEENIRVHEEESANKRKFDLDDLEIENLQLGCRIKDVIKTYGQANKIESELYAPYGTCRRYVYDDIKFTFYNQLYDPNDEDSYTLDEYIIFTEKIAGPRGIRVGDNVYDALKHFPDEGRGVLYGTNYRYLYGKEYEHNATIRYDDKGEIELLHFIYFIDVGFGFIMDMEVRNDKISRIKVITVV